MVDIGGVPHYYKGDLSLLQRPKISIVGSRRPLPYTQTKVLQLASQLSQKGYVIVSGAAMGVDALAHKGAGPSNTIAVLGNGLDIYYPKVNEKLISSIEKEGLLLSQFEPGFAPTKWSFVVRNKTVVALGDVLVIAQADKRSGSMRSTEYAIEMGKKIYVLPHRMGESEGTQELVKKGLAEVIWSIEEFVGSTKEDDFIAYLRSNPSFEEAIQRWGDRIMEAELSGVIEIEHAKIIYKEYLLNVKT